MLQTEGRVTLIDGILAAAVLLGLALNAVLSWWWADRAAGYVLVVGRPGRRVRARLLRDRQVWEIFSGPSASDRNCRE